jgi:hypothetical protein
MMKTPTTYIAMTPDVVMSDLLKTSRSSEIFSITGLPDVTLKPAGNNLHQVEVMQPKRNNSLMKTKTSPRKTTAKRYTFLYQGSGNNVGKAFPWIVSDFGLLDAIESGLVKIPQLPSRDVTGADEAAYFNIWRRVQAKADEDGYGSKLTLEIVMNYASAPINLLAAEWHQRFQEWESTSKRQHKHPVPPVFIVVCRDTAVAKEVYSWMANGNDSYGASPHWFKNQPGQEVMARRPHAIANRTSPRKPP